MCVIVSDRMDRVKQEWDKTAVSDWYMGYRKDNVVLKIIQEPESLFHPNTFSLLKKYISDFRGRHILVPSSGDNRAVFAFAALGADVTSCDISEKQIELAERTAKKHNLSIQFQIENTMKLDGISNESYDFVYTSEGVHVWIDDLNGMYQNIWRVLKPDGIYINYEIHPIVRPFDYSDGKPKDKDIIVQNDYDIIGPFDDGLIYHWRTMDILNAVATSGFVLLQLEEMHDNPVNGHFWFYEEERKKMSSESILAYYDYHTNPLAALPQWFSIAARKV